jgi:hypothetical protein
MKKLLFGLMSLLSAGAVQAEVFNTPTIGDMYVFPGVAGNNIPSAEHGGNAGAQRAADKFCEHVGYASSKNWQFYDYGWHGSRTPHSARWVEEWKDGQLSKGWHPVQTGIRFNYIECI